MKKLYKPFSILIIVFAVFTISPKSSLAQGFTDVTELAGIEIVHDGDEPELDTDFMDLGSGAAWLDYNNDGLLDLYVTMRLGRNLLFENQGFDDTAEDFIFEEVAVAAGADDPDGDGAGVAVADFNNDGFLDIYLANVDEDKLLKNNGDETFDEIITGSGLDVTDASRATSASWGDYDGDGYLDLYLSHHERRFGATGTNQDFLFHNDGDETFTDVSDLLADDDINGFGFIGGWTDIDNDGDLDIILINDCVELNPNPQAQTKTKIFRNDGDPEVDDPVTNWPFTEVAISIGVDDCRNGMGIAVGDLDRDGWLDFFYSNIGECVLYQNDQDGTFSDITTAAGVGGQNQNHYSWGCSFLDYDLDGWQDIIVAFGSLNNTSTNHPWKNQLFRNDGDNTFTDVAGDPGMNMDDISKSRSAVFGDYDNDGDQDIFLVNYGEQCILKRNDNNNGNHWLKVKLVGNPAQGSNKDGIGAKLKLTYGNNEVQYFETRSGSNLGGGDELIAFFGLGNATTVDELEITWPSGNVTTEFNILVDQHNEFEEPGPLPVEWFSFTAQAEKENVVLNWTTASEINSDYFVVQRSEDGRRFENLGYVESVGTATGFSSYQFIDEHPLIGNNYYRLKQIDRDGKAAFSHLEYIIFETEENFLSILPNPVLGDEFDLIFKTVDNKLKLEIYDVSGRLIKSQDLENVNSTNSMSLTTNGLNPGLYLINLVGASTQMVTKLVIR